MSTSFLDIYSRAISEIDDPALTTAYSNNPLYFYQLMYNYLVNAIPLFNSPITMIAKLGTQTNPTGATETYVGDGTSASFVLSTNPLPDSQFNYLISGCVVTGSYVTSTSGVIFEYPPPYEEIASAEWYSPGSFTNTLNTTEQTIMGELVVLCWAEKEKNFLLDIRRLLSDAGDFKLHDASASMRSKGGWYNEMRETVEKRMNSYAWNTKLTTFT